jgi:hypothetical protein
LKRRKIADGGGCAVGYPPVVLAGVNNVSLNTGMGAAAATTTTTTTAPATAATTAAAVAAAVAAIHSTVSKGSSNNALSSFQAPIVPPRPAAASGLSNADSSAANLGSGDGAGSRKSKWGQQ